MAMPNIKLTRLINADDDVVGYFSDHVAEMAARKEWDEWNHEHAARVGLTIPRCRSVETLIVSTQRENVEPGDGDRVDYIFDHDPGDAELSRRCAARSTENRVGEWLRIGAASVDVRRYLVNKYRRPGMSNRDADLGGPVEAAGVLYVLVVKAPR